MCQWHFRDNYIRCFYFNTTTIEHIILRTIISINGLHTQGTATHVICESCGTFLSKNFEFIIVTGVIPSAMCPEMFWDIEIFLLFIFFNPCYCQKMKLILSIVEFLAAWAGDSSWSPFAYDFVIRYLRFHSSVQFMFSMSSLWCCDTCIACRIVAPVICTSSKNSWMIGANFLQYLGYDSIVILAVGCISRSDTSNST